MPDSTPPPSVPPPGHEPSARRSAGGGRPRRRLPRGGRRTPVVVAIGVALGLAACSQTSRPVSSPPGASVAPRSAGKASASRRTADPTRCPLTGTPAAGGVPARPALAIKIGNNPSARPQSGLDHADIVFEEPIEGAITRLLAVFQCQGAGQVGPVRSTRWIDMQLLPQFGHPAFGFAGGINPDQQLVANSGVYDLNFTNYYSDYVRSPARYAPNNLYTSTSTLWSLDPSHVPPPAVFAYSNTVPAGKPVSAAQLTYSGIYSVGWTWDPGIGAWARSVNGAVDDDLDGSRVVTSNVVIMTVQTTPGPYVEDSEGAHGVHSLTVGSGPVVVLRNGEAISGTWERSSVNAPFRFHTATGALIRLSPGHTWVNLLPVSGSLALTPAG